MAPCGAIERKSGRPWGRRAYSALRIPALASRPGPSLTCLAVAFYGSAGIDARTALQRLRRVAPSSQRREIVAGKCPGNHPQFVVRLLRNVPVEPRVASKLAPTMLATLCLLCGSELARDSSLFEVQPLQPHVRFQQRPVSLLAELEVGVNYA